MGRKKNLHDEYVKLIADMNRWSIRKARKVTSILNWGTRDNPGLRRAVYDQVRLGNYRLDKLISTYYARAKGVQNRYLTDAARLSVEALIKMFQSVLQGDLIVPVDASDSADFMGATINQHFKKQEQNAKWRINTTIRQNRDESADVIVKALGMEAFPRIVRDVDALSRTAFNHVFNQAHLAVYKANSRHVKGVQWLATLDGRTCLRCASLDGKVWTLDDHRPVGHKTRFPGHPPIHFNDRCTLLAVLKEETLESTRASMYGQVPAGTNFESWLKKQPVSFQKDWFANEEMYRAWKDGKLTLSQLIKAGLDRPLTRKEVIDRIDKN